MNAADPLAQLRDIHLPEPVGWWPPAPGWWIVAIIVLLLGLLTFLFLRKRWRARAHRRSSQVLLTQYFEQWRRDKNTSRYLQQCNALLKRVALVSFPNQEIAPVTAQSWIDFLQSKVSANTKSPYNFLPLKDAIYKENAGDIGIEKLHQDIGLWLKLHREPSDD